MADIQVIDFLKEVESNRQSLIANAQSKGKVIDKTASLTEAVAVNNTIEPCVDSNKIEVRFFDADGTLLQTNYIECGGSVTPPANPNYDPTRLTFKRWASAIGEQFTNITHDVDYGALYTINDGAYHLFCTFNDTTGYTVTLTPYQNAAHTITIDWGDGTENDTKTNSGTTYISHTYAQAGDYEIIVSSDTPIDYPTYYYYLRNDVLSTSSSASVIDGLINAYMPIFYGSNFENTEGLQTAVVESVNNLTDVNRFKNIVLSNNLTTMGYFSLRLYNTKTLIIDNTLIVDDEISISNNYGGLDKLIIPNSITSVRIYSFNTLKKLISYSKEFNTSTSSSAPHLKSLQLLGLQKNSILNTFNNLYELEEFIYPINNIVAIDGSYAPSSKLKQVLIPENCTVESSLLSNMYFLQTIILPQNFNQSLTISSYQITIPSIIDMLNKVQDNTGGTAQTLILPII